MIKADYKITEHREGDYETGIVSYTCQITKGDLVVTGEAGTERKAIENAEKELAFYQSDEK